MMGGDHQGMSEPWWCSDRGCAAAHIEAAVRRADLAAGAGPGASAARSSRCGGAGGGTRVAVIRGMPRSNQDPGPRPRWAWRLGRVAGISIYLHATFLLLLAWIAVS